MVGKDGDLLDELFDQSLIKLCDVGFLPGDEVLQFLDMTDDYVITAVYDASVKYRLIEEYGPNSFTEREDGSLYTQWGFTRPDDAAAWFLGFGNKVKVLAPPEMVERMKNALESIKNLYET